jgi:hypothetical protein
VLTLAAALIVTITVATTPTEPDGAQLTPFEQSLDRLPADALDEESAILYYVDMEQAWQRAGVGPEVEERLQRAGSLGALPTWTQAPQLFGQYFTQVDEARAEVGFTMLDVDREITVQSPPHSIVIAETRVTPDEVTTAVESDPLWSSELRMVEQPDGTYFEWGEDPTAQDLARRSPMRPLGQGGQLALVGGDGEATVVRTVDPADMQSVLATVTGAGDSLLDDELFAAALPALTDGVVMQVMAVDQPIGFDPVALGLTPEEFEQLLAELVLVGPYEGLVIAELFDGEQSLTKVLLVYADTAAAESNSVVVEQAIAEGVDPVTREPLADLLPGSDVSVIGSAVVITLPFEGAYPLAQRMLTQRSLFPSG